MSKTDYTKTELVKMVAKYIGTSQTAAAAFLDGYEKFVIDSLLLGMRVKMGRLGVFELQTVKAMPARKGYNPITNVAIDLPPREAYNKIKFKPYKVMQKTIRDATEGDVL